MTDRDTRATSGPDHQDDRPPTRSGKRKAAPAHTPSAGMPDNAPVQRPVRLMTAPQIMLHLHNEHKYMTKLINVMNEQLAMLDVKQVPDFKLMHEVVHYLHTYSDTEHHAREDVVYRKLSQVDPAYKQEVELLLIEHETMHKKAESLMNALSGAMLEPSIEIAEKLRFRCEDYLATLSNHMDLEESQIFPRIREVLTDADWAEIINEIQPLQDPLFGKEVEKRYQELFDAISNEMGKAADDFTVAEFIGLHAAMENIGLIATYSNRIGGIVNKRFRQAYRGNAVAYRKLMRSRSRSPSDYVSVTVDCMLNNFDTYTDTLKEIGRVLRKARSQIAEPYASRLKIYHETSRLPTSGSDADERPAA